jgi:PAS domain S-box-containing protein
MKELHDLAVAQALALAIVDTLPEPFLVLDDALHLLAGSRCFYEVFGEDPAEAHGRSLFELSNGEWDIPGLRQLLASVVPQHKAVEGFEFEQSFCHLGKRTIQLNALPIRDETGASRMVLVAIKDITERRVAEQEKHDCSNIPRSCLSSKEHCSARCGTASRTACRSLPASCS